MYEFRPSSLTDFSHHPTSLSQLSTFSKRTLKYSGLKWPPLILVTVLTWAQWSSFIAPNQLQTRLLWLWLLAVDWVMTEVRVTCFLSFSHLEQGCSRGGRKIPSGRAVSALVGKLFVQVRFHPVGQTQWHGQCQGQGGGQGTELPQDTNAASRKHWLVLLKSDYRSPSWPLKLAQKGLPGLFSSHTMALSLPSSWNFLFPCLCPEL